MANDDRTKDVSDEDEEGTASGDAASSEDGSSASGGTINDPLTRSDQKAPRTEFRARTPK